MRPRVRPRALTALAAAAALWAAAAPAPAAGQPAREYPAVDVRRGGALLRRVTDVRDGTVRLTFTPRPDVCGTPNGIRTRGDARTHVGEGGMTLSWNQSRDVEWDDRCEPGPGRLALDVRDGEVTDVRFHVGGRWRAPEAGRRVTDLGAAPAPEVAAMLLAVAERGGGKAARQAIFPATLADSVSTWPALLRLARDSARPAEARKQALVWVARAAGDVAARGLTELTDDADREVRVQAVFALSRRPKDEAIPALTRVARTHRDPELRRQALFWLARIDDPRVVTLFEELLTR
jgi:hypothetical protein